MTTSDGDGGFGGSATELGELARAVASAVERPRAAAPPPSAVAFALDGRARGKSYAELGRRLAEPLRLKPAQAAKAASLWCRTAETLDPSYRAGGEPRKAREGTGRSRPVAARLDPGLYERLIVAADGRPVSGVVEAAVKAYLRRVVPGKGEVMSLQRRKALQEALSRVADELAGIRVQAAGIGKNVNQQTKFINTYRELPVKHSVELARMNDGHEAVVTQLDAVRASIDALLEAG